jgi:YD repeat-containing protein
MATGEVYLSQTDVVLPGVLPLILKRAHLSHYRHGQFFGPSWASTLDERLETATAGSGGELWWHRADGSSLRYSHAPDLVGELVQPREGRRLALTRVQGHGGWDLAVHDPHTGLTRRFLPADDDAAPTVWWLMEISDRWGNTLIIERDPKGVPTSASHSGNYQVNVHTTDGVVTGLGLQGEPGEIRLATYGYDGDRNLVEVTNSSELPLRFTYDADHRLTSWTDRNGSTYSYVYDLAGRVERTVGPDGCLSSRLTYDTEQRITRYTDSTGAVTTYHFNELGQVIAERDPLGHVRHTEWDRYDRVLCRTDALGRTTSFEYDEHGNTSAVVHPDGTRSETTYNRHLPVEVLLPSGARQLQEYDNLGNRTAVTDVAGATTRFTYNDLGYLTSITDPLGNTTRLRCNAAGLPTEVVDPLGAVTRYERGVLGHPVAITDPVGATLRLEWTVEGKLASRTAADGTIQRWAYDGEGNCTSHTDANGSVTSFEYTHFDKIAARTGPDGARYSFDYDTELRVTSVTGPQGLTWQYQYDPAGRLTSETDFDGRTLTYTHDAGGQLVSRTTAAGEATHYERDVLGRTAPEVASLRQTRDVALPLGLRGPSHRRCHPRRHALAILLRPTGTPHSQAETFRRQPDGCRANRLLLGWRYAVRADHSPTREARSGRHPELGAPRVSPSRPGRTKAPHRCRPRASVPTGDRRALLRDRHRSCRYADGTP